jgi:hypothetical protein
VAGEQAERLGNRAMLNANFRLKTKWLTSACQTDHQTEIQVTFYLAVGEQVNTIRLSKR